VSAKDGVVSERRRTEQQQGTGGLNARAILRGALVDGEDPRFPWWLPLPGLVAAVTWAAFQASVGASDFLPTLAWPGTGIVALVTLVTWFGWQLDID
jgi:hypothetical protein